MKLKSVPQNSQHAPRQQSLKLSTKSSTPRVQVAKTLSQTVDGEQLQSNQLTEIWTKVRKMTTPELEEACRKVAKRRRAQIWSPVDELMVLELTRRQGNAQVAAGAVRGGGTEAN